MIVARAPMRISFVGGGTDFPEFYHDSPGASISTAFDKFVYIVVNRTPFIDKVSARYSITETVDHASMLDHTRIRAALLDLGIERGLEIASFASLPAKTGMGSSSSFSVALIKALHAYLGNNIGPREAAEAACRLEIELLREPIGKQDQYAAAFGGFNVLWFHSNGVVDVEPVLLDYKTRLDFEEHLIVFYTGIVRFASSVLEEQRANIPRRLDILKDMAGMVPVFRDCLLAGDFRAAGSVLHEGWIKKKSLASGVSNAWIDSLYEAGMRAGAWGGKLLGGGGGGCALFVAPPERKAGVRRAVAGAARLVGLEDFKEISVRLVQSGAEVLYCNKDTSAEPLLAHEGFDEVVHS